MLKKTFLYCSVFGLFALLPGAQATILNPGDSNVVIGSLPAPNGNLLAQVSGSISPGTFTASYTEWVYTDSNNVFCSGCLDFIYQVTNSGPGVIERVTGFNFGSFMVDAGYFGTGVAPGTASRTNDGNGQGDVVGFNFLGNGELSSGETTNYLIIETNAPNYEPGLVSIQDGSAGTGAGFGPATPEPASISLLGAGLGLVLIPAFRRFRASRG